MVYIFFADGFEEIEAFAAADVLRRADLEVVTVGIGGKNITGAHGITVVTDIEDKEITTDKISAVVLPGGMPGTLNLEKSPIVRTCIDYCISNALYIGAICAAPSILGHMGYLNGKKAICFPGFEEQLTGAEIVDAPAVADGKIITGKGPGAAVDFALELVKKLKSENLADSIKQSMQCK